MQQFFALRRCLLFLVAISIVWGAGAQGTSGARGVLVEFESPALCAVWRDAGNDAKAAVETALAAIDGEHAAFRETLSAKGIAPPVLFALKRVLNGIALRVDAAGEAAVRTMPGVRRVRPLRTHYPSNSAAIPFVQAPSAWVSTGSGLLGDGVRVGVVDTGIDYIHLNFGGAGASGDYNRNNETILGDVPFPNDVVVGGVDLAGENYDPDSLFASQPDPDPDPFDGDGHGSHVAGTLAGRGVLEGTMYDGPYNEAVDFEAFDVGPGVAPGVSLYAIKIFGAPGAGTLLVSQALEYAVDPNEDGDLSDRLDVVNMSLGAPYNLVDGRSPEIEATENAVSVGVVVVASSGNEGDTYFITGEPGAAPSAISVAASYHDGVPRESMTIDAPESLAGTIAMHASAFGPSFPDGGLAGTIVAAAPLDGCGPIENADLLNGAIALIDRGDCLFGDKVRAAQNAGAIAVVFVNNIPGDTIIPGGVGVQVSIPSGMIRQEEGARIRAALANGPVEVTLGLGEQPATDLADTMAAFSSRGPAWDGERIWSKPDITAPGVEIRSTGLETGDGDRLINGTSMAAPQVAGAAALLLQAHPAWPPQRVKARLMNTALHDTFRGARFTPPRHTAARSGAGVLDVGLAAGGGIVAFDAARSAGVALVFEPYEHAVSTTVTGTVRVENHGPTALTLEPSLDTVFAPAGVTFSLPEDNGVTVDAGGFADIAVALHVDRTELETTRAPALAETQSESPRHFLTEASGFLALDAGGVTVARTPLYTIAQPATEVTVLDESFSDSGPLTLFADRPTRALLFELHDELANDPATPVSRDWADLAAVGASVGRYAFDGVEGNALYVAAMTHGDWSSPNGMLVRVELDFGTDESADYIVYNTSAGAEQTGEPNDVFQVALETARTGAVSVVGDLNGWDATVDTRLFLTNVMVLPVPLYRLPASDRTRPFRYRVRVEPQIADESSPTMSTSRWVSIDPSDPGLRFVNNGPVPPHVDVDGETATPVDFHLEGYLAANARGIAVVAPHETRGNRLKVVRRAAAVLDTRASDGTFADRVRVTWTPLGNEFEYRVLRSDTDSFEDAQALGGFQTAASFDDFTAAPAQSGGVACNGDVTTQAQRYWVVSRRMGTTDEVVGASDTGFVGAAKRARTAAAVAPWGDMAGILAATMWVGFRRRRYRG